MAGFSTILGIFLHNTEIANLKIFFYNGIDFQLADCNFINKYNVYQFNKYITTNINNYDLWNSIQINFRKFKTKYFNQLKNTI